MRITLIGSGTGYPVTDRNAPAILVTSSGVTVLIDCGVNTVRNLLSAGTLCTDIDCLLISHLHPDHTLDMISLTIAVSLGRTP